MAECPCSNISIMQLFHELKQKFPAVPDSVVTECIKLNSHDREVCEAVLSRENQTYSFPGGRVCKMATEGTHEPCRPDSLQLEDTVWDVERRLTGRQSLDSLRCVRGSAQHMCKQYSEECLNKREDLGAFSRLSIHDECEWRSRQSGRSVECGSEESECHCKRTRCVVSYGPPHSAPVTPSNPPPLTVNVRHFTSLNVEPAPHYRGLPEPSRPYTSVNLTLRPPSSDPQPPIDISSAGGGLTYSSCSYDPRQGYQSRLQISIGPGGQGTVTAARTLHRPHPELRPATSMPDVATTSAQLAQPALTSNLPPATEALVAEQLERKERLSRELAKYKERLSSMKANVRSMTADLERLKNRAPSEKVKRLKEEISLLQTKCNRMTNDVYHNAELKHMNTETLPLGETDEEFYKNKKFYRGQPFPQQVTRQRPITAPPEPPPPPVMMVGEGRHWTCHVCTFHNHPALNKCEQCDMPRIITGSLTPAPPPLKPSLPPLSTA